MPTFHVDVSQTQIRALFSPPLVQATLLRRYKRFLADVRLSDGREVTAHCMNPGSMKGLTAEGSLVWLTPHDDPKRKLQWTWQIAHEGACPVGVNTNLPNHLVAAAAEAGAIEALTGYTSFRREVRYGAERSRIDLLAEGHPKDARPCYVEIKSVTLADAGTALFPDAVTARGLKHLRELERVVAQGHRAIMFYLVQRADCQRFAPARSIDPAYAEGVLAAKDAGVEVLVYSAQVSPEGITLGAPILTTP
uniref:Sugar fermentation stimulation protein homolog n=3 Tax=environmental samples TaxID=48479 RepID=C7FPC7_9BACT|nr:DNA-binding protein [uncultured bacterium HF186_25m_30B18]ACU26430.1 DNA-binding protein [uncultured bacterium HF186_75m_14K15]ACU26491.1 DNA-binding protein [uncultured bacterium HF186_25m_13D19]